MKKEETAKKALEIAEKPSKRELGTFERASIASAGMAMAFMGARNFRKKGWMLTLLGSALTYVGVSGKNPLYAINKQDKKPLKASAKILINRDKASVYNFWRKLENLSLFMDHIKEVKEVSEIRSKWTANLNGMDLNWEAEITEDEKDEKISWRSLIISSVRNSGRVLFRTAPDLSGTEVFVEIEYASDAGRIAKIFASIYQPLFEKQIMDDLKECKKILEVDKVPHLAKNHL